MNESSPRVSIVLPIYNSAKYMRQSIDSCINQTYKNVQLIIVDDGSTDETPEIIKSYEDERIRYIRHDKNLGLPHALNTGFANATGEYLTWTSDDNYYRPQALAEMVAFLESEPTVDVVYADYTAIDEAGCTLQNVLVGMPEELVRLNCIGACFLYRRAVQEKLGGYAEDLFLAEDYDFWLRASVSFRLHPLHKDLYLFRRHNTSLTSLRIERVRLVAAQALSRNLPYMDWLDDTLRAKGYLRLAVEAQAHNEVAPARRYVLRAMRYSPTSVMRQVSLGFLAFILLGQKGACLLRSVCRKLKHY